MKDNKLVTAFDNFGAKFFRFYQRFLINQKNKKLKYFHLVVSITLFFDFYFTGLIMGNYLFMSGQ